MAHKMILVGFFIVVASDSFSAAIRLTTARGLLEDSPIVVKGTVNVITPSPNDGIAFPGFQHGAHTSKAEMTVQYSLKGDVPGERISFLFVEGDADLSLIQIKQGETYLLFLEDSSFGLRLFDPQNGAIAAAPQELADKPKDAAAALRKELEMLLDCRDTRLVLVGLRELASIGDVDSLKKIKPYLDSRNETLWLAASTVAMAIGDWQQLVKLVKYLDLNSRNDGGIQIPDEAMRPVASSAFKYLSTISDKSAAPILKDLLESTQSSRIHDAIKKSLKLMSYE